MIGFYIVKRVRRWDIEKYITNYTDYSDKMAKYNVIRKQMTKDKAIAVDAEGYNKFFILDGKKLDIQNFDMNQEQVKKGIASELKESLVNQCKIDWFQSSFKQIHPGGRINETR